MPPRHPRLIHVAASKKPLCGHGGGGVGTKYISAIPNPPSRINLCRHFDHHADAQHRKTMLSQTCIAFSRNGPTSRHGGFVTIQSHSPLAVRKSFPSAISNQSHPGIARTNAPSPLHGSSNLPLGLKCETMSIANSSGVNIRCSPSPSAIAARVVSNPASNSRACMCDPQPSNISVNRTCRKRQAG